MMLIADHMDEMRVAEEGTSEKNQFNHLADQPWTKETTETMRVAESKLDRF